MEAASRYAWGDFLQHHPILFAAWIAAALSMVLGVVLIPLLWVGTFERGVTDPATGTEDLAPPGSSRVS